MLRPRHQLAAIAALLSLLHAACLTNNQNTGSSVAAGKFRLERPNIQADGNDLSQLVLQAYQRDSQKPIAGAKVTWLATGCLLEQAEQQTDSLGTARLILKANEPGLCTVKAQITVGEASITLDQSATVLAYATPPAGLTPGAEFKLRLALADVAGFTDSNYTGQITLRSSDPLASLPTDMILTAQDSGQVQLEVIFRTAGQQTLSAFDAASGRQLFSQTFQVGYGSATQLALRNLPQSLTAGSPLTGTVEVLDDFNNLVLDFSGSLRLLCQTDTQADCTPAGLTICDFTPNDAGRKSCLSAWHLQRQGLNHLRVASTSTPSLQSPAVTVAVLPTDLHLLRALLPAAVRAGEPTNLHLQASDAYGNVNSIYTGTVSLSSSDGNAIFPSTITFTTADAGIKVVPAGLIFRTAGSQQLSLTASNAAPSSVQIEVLPAAHRQVFARPLSPNAALMPPAPEVPLSATDMQQRVATPATVQLWVADSYGNRDRAFAGFVSLTACASADALSCPSPVFSANVNFSPNDLGVKAFSLPILWQSSGSYSLLAQALGHASWASGRANVEVLSGPPTSYSLTAASDPNGPLGVVAGTSTELTLTGRDLYGNLAAGPIALRLTSSDGHASFTSEITLPAGAPLQLTFPITLRTAGNHTLTLYSGGNASEQVASWPISVLPAPATQADPILASSAQAGEALDLTLVAKDPYGNVDPSFTGNVLLISSDPLASLPGAPLPAINPNEPVAYSIAFAQADAGLKVLPAALRWRSAGAQQLSAQLANSNIATSKSLTVTLASSRFAYAVPALSGSAYAGVPVALRFFVGDVYGNVDTAFTGTLAAYATGQPTPVYTQLLPADGGSVVVSAGFVFNRSGSYALRTEYAGSSPLAIAPGASSVQVILNPERSARLQFMADPIAGTALDAEVWIGDAYGNLDRDFTGTLAVTTSDPNATVLPSITFAAADRGWKMLPQGFVFRAAGSQSITLSPLTTQLGVSGSTQTFPVAPAAPAAVRHALKTGTLSLTQLQAGVAYDLELHVADSYGNSITNQNTPVYLRSSDANALLPASVVLMANDLGTKRVPAAATLLAAGAQSITSSLAPNGSGYTTSYNVIQASSRYAYITLLSPLVLAGQPATVDVRIADAYRNVFADFTGDVVLAGQGSPQFDSNLLVFSSNDAGIKTATVVFPSSGSFALSSSLPPGSEVLGRTITLQVQPPSAVRYLNLIAPGSQQAGQATSLQLFVTKQSPANPNLHILDTSFTGSVTLSTSDANAIFSQAPGQAYTYTFQGSDNGNVLLSNALQLRTAGPQSITANSDNPSHQPSTATINVTPSSHRFANLSALSMPQVGQPLSLQVFITDDYGNLATNSPKTLLSLQSSDANASLVSPISLLAVDEGNKLIPNAVTFFQAGSQSLTLGGNDLNGNTLSLPVAPGPIATTTLSLSNQSPQTGQTVTFQISAFDGYGNLVTTASNALQLSVSDAAATYPQSFNLQNGVYSGTIVFRTTGPQSVSLRLPGSGATLSQVNVAVSLSSDRYAHAALGYTPSSVQSTAEAGALVPLQVWVGDAYGNIDPSFTGTIDLQSSDALASLPASLTLTAAHAGARISATTTRFRTAGATTLTATAPGLSSWPRSFSVTPGAQQYVYARPTSNPNAGQSVALNVWAADAYANLVTSFTGAVTLTSSDSQATLPSPLTFTAANNGNLLLESTAVFRTAGSQSLSSSSAVNAGTQSFSVGLGSGRYAYAAPYSFGNLITSPQIGSAYDLRVYVADSYSNVDPSFTGTLLVDSSDTNIQLASSGNYPITGADAGARLIPNGVTFGSAGAQTLIARPAGQSSVILQTTPVTVRTGAIASYALSIANPNVQAGQSMAVTITAYDSAGNVASNSPSTSLSLISADPNATLSSNLVLNQGYGTFQNAALFRTSGLTTLSLVPSGLINSTPLVTVNVNVLPGNLASLRLLVPTTVYQGMETFDDTIVPNTVADLILSLLDAYGNILPSYANQVQITGSSIGLVPVSLNATSYVKNDPNGMRLPQAVQVTALGTSVITAQDMNSGLSTSRSLRGRQIAALSEGAGGRQACAMLYDGRMKCWGMGGSSQLGYGDTLSRGNTVGQMAGNLPFISLSSGRQALAAIQGYDQTCTLLDNGALQCWGGNASGQLGVGDTAGRTTPSAAFFPGSGRRAVAIATGWWHTCAVLDNQRASCWGWNTTGMVGVGDTTNRTTAGLWVQLATGRTASQVACGYSSTCSLLDTAQVNCWGAATYGALGLGDATHRYSPPATPVALAANRTAINLTPQSYGYHVLYDNRDMTGWGYNIDGRLGLGDTTARGGSANQMGANLPIISLGAGRKVLALNYGGDTARFPLLDNRSLVAWGSNPYGSLGLGLSGDRGSSPTHMGNNLLSINLGAGQIPIRVSSGHFQNATCALLNSDNIKCWGGGANGTLGLSDTNDRGLLPSHMGDNLPAVPLLTATPWTVAQSAPIVWLDANSNTTLLPTSATNSNVFAWNSKAPALGYSAIPGGGDSSKPQIITNGRNNMPVVRFDNNMHLAFSPHIETTRTVVLAMRWNSWADFATVLGGYNEYLWVGGAGNLAFHSTIASSNVINGTSYRNGVSIAPASLTRTLDWQILYLTTTANTRIQNIGRDRTYISQCFDGDIAEMLVFDYVLSDAQRQRVEGYLAQKWGLSSALVAGHPFASVTPVFN